MVDVRIVYVAEAAPGVANADVQDIVHRSRRNNAIAGITGILIWTGSVFLQAIEGSSDAVWRLLEVIEADHRHLGIMIISEKTIDQRLSPDWAMACVRTLPDVSAQVLADALSMSPDQDDVALRNLAAESIPFTEKTNSAQRPSAELVMRAECALLICLDLCSATKRSMTRR